jgi:hypothetical protein
MPDKPDPIAQLAAQDQMATLLRNLGEAGATMRKKLVEGGMTQLIADQIVARTIEQVLTGVFPASGTARP